MQLRWLERKPGEWVLQTRHVEHNGVFGPGGVTVDSGWQDVPEIPHDAGEPKDTEATWADDIIDERVITIISQQLDVPGPEIKRHLSLEADLGADSLDVAELEMAFNDDFDIQIRDEDTEGMDTVADAIRIVKQTMKREIQE